MPIFTVDIVCRSPEHDYAALFGLLRGLDAQNLLETRWLLDVGESVGTLTQRLLGLCAPGDGLFVTELAPETRWSGTGLGDPAKAWFLARMRPVPAQPLPPERRPN